MPEDYPVTLLEFERRFASEEACRDYLVSLRWPEGFQCPLCRSAKAWPRHHSNRIMECAGCGHKVSPTAGTVFDRTRLPLRLWFRAIWLITSQKNGMSAVSLQKQLGLKRYETAWTMLHKLRRAMVRPGRERLWGRVEVDEIYIGGEDAEVRGRQTSGKALVVVAAEEDGNGVGRIRLQSLADASRSSLNRFMEENVEPGSVVHTDAWSGYAELIKNGYQHEVTRIKGSGKLGHELMPRVHRVASLLKRWLLGTHQGGVRPPHLHYYLDEFTFRFNRRTSRERGKLFYRLVQQAVQLEPVHWKNIAKGERGGHHNI